MNDATRTICIELNDATRTILLKLFTVHQNIYEMCLQFELKSTLKNMPIKNAGKNQFLGAFSKVPGKINF